ncbi:CidA/LrgA family protein [Rhodocyclus tenuis]|uniref:CidA/LrgA family protein n=2 Tax=Rhodocyclus TaxID=1064 RepID=A0A6L5JWV0_RHOTE|nr:CidA/LrgA family protein [Rhodocyclus gracilis]MQY51709.1 CidA/LrgA family protein [Rhodocyclus gracilis]MRD73189.1 CidA/LrgA family protein [Rhodocyclus gracilis]NJA89030.1 CidA/LrgA family protein [Rhodocyclus gracilis]
MIAALALFLSCQLLGETIARLLSLPVPGPVLGMLFLLAWLVVRGGPQESERRAAGGLLQHLPLLFVPAGTGVLLHLHRLAAEAMPIAVALIGSTVIGLAVAGLTLSRLTRAGRAGKIAAND